MASRRTRTIVKLVVWCLLVGLVLSLFEISPLSVLANISQNARDVFKVAVDAVAWAVPFVLAGAVIVLPIWLAIQLVQLFRGRK